MSTTTQNLDAKSLAFFEGMNDPEKKKVSSGRATPVLPGIYIARIEHSKIRETKNYDQLLIHEMKILKVVKDPTGDGNRPGQEVSRIYRKNGPSAPYFFGEVAHDLGRILGVSTDKVTMESCAEMVGPTQPLRRTIVEFEVTEVERTNKEGETKTFPNIEFLRRVSDPAEIAELDALGI